MASSARPQARTYCEDCARDIACHRGCRQRPSPEYLRTISRALADDPRLTLDGIGPFDGAESFEAQQARFFTRYAERQFEAALAWIATRNIRTALERRCTSYERKHEAERWLQKRGAEWWYVSNGALLAACRHLDIPYRAWRPGNLNAFTAIGAPKRRPR